MIGNAPERPLFSVLGIPISVSLWHPLMMAMIFYPYFQTSPALGLAMVLVGSASILLHELGHALVCRTFGLEPHIALITFGGNTFHQPARRPRDEFLIVAAGPAMNFALALGFNMVEPYTGGLTNAVVTSGIFINIFWGLFNLVPVLPLDGGQILRIVLHKVVRGLKADRMTHWIGVVVGVLVALGFGFGLKSLMGAMFMALFALNNWQALKLLDDHPDRHATEAHGRVRELLASARDAYQGGQFEEAMRYCHQARAEPYLSREEMEHCWQVLALCAARLDSFEEALRYAERVPGSRDMAHVQASCLLALREPTRIKRFLATPTAMLLDQARVEELQAVARG